MLKRLVDHAIMIGVKVSILDLGSQDGIESKEHYLGGWLPTWRTRDDLVNFFFCHEPEGLEAAMVVL